MRKSIVNGVTAAAHGNGSLHATGATFDCPATRLSFRRHVRARLLSPGTMGARHGDVCAAISRACNMIHFAWRSAQVRDRGQGRRLHLVGGQKEGRLGTH